MSSETRFVDASVFVHAYLKPRRELKPHEEAIKRAARGIVKRINDGEQVITTVIHLGEISNVLEDYMNLEEALSIVRALCLRENIIVLDISDVDLLTALDTSESRGVGMTDALAHVAMERQGIKEIYSFDKDFDRLDGIERKAD